MGVPKLYRGEDLRWSYVTWQEPANPFIIIELLSPGTEGEDLGETESEAGKPPTKWRVYEEILKIPYYLVFSRHRRELRGFYLTDGVYEEMTLSEGRLLIPELGLSLGVWEGEFQGVERTWLRWLTLAGEFIPIPEEEAELAKEEAALARQREEAAQRRAEQLAERLRELGIDPDEV